MYLPVEVARRIVPFPPCPSPQAVAPPRTAILASADLSFRRRTSDALTALRWQVREASGGAETLMYLAECAAEVVIVDTWLPDLEVSEFLTELESLHPAVDVISVDDPGSKTAARSPRRSEVLLALRRGQDGEDTTSDATPGSEPQERAQPVSRAIQEASVAGKITPAITCGSVQLARGSSQPSQRLPELIGEHPAMLEVSRRVRLAAPHRSTVLIQGPSGTGKELVARGLHRLSPRANRPFVALNCAAIPEALLEAELFGHTRGAFTGAVQGRTGRIEAAHGGTLFLDEVGEMPLAAQAKLLRFLECGELQRVGDNETVKVNVRLIAATHRPLARLAQEGGFRSDLYYRLSVFFIRTPPLASRIEDLALLTAHCMERLGERSPAKSLHPDAMQLLSAHSWPGNVRELEHVLERAWILAEDRPEIAAAEIEFGDSETAS